MNRRPLTQNLFFSNLNMPPFGRISQKSDHVPVAIHGIVSINIAGMTEFPAAAKRLIRRRIGSSPPFCSKFQAFLRHISINNPNVSNADTHPPIAQILNQLNCSSAIIRAHGFGLRAGCAPDNHAFRAVRGVQQRSDCSAALLRCAAAENKKRTYENKSKNNGSFHSAFAPFARLLIFIFYRAALSFVKQKSPKERAFFTIIPSARPPAVPAR